MNYHIAITNELRKTGWTSHRCRLRGINRWARVEKLKKQYYKLGFKNATCESTYTCKSADIEKADKDSYMVEQWQHAYLGARGYHAGNKEKHGTGWTEIFKVSANKLKMYRLLAIKKCKSLNWDLEALQKALKQFCLKHFNTETWAEKCYGYNPCRTSPLDSSYKYTAYDKETYYQSAYDKFMDWVYNG